VETDVLSIPHFRILSTYY